MSHLVELKHILLVVCLAVAVATDIRSYKVYNWLTWPAICVGLILGAAGGADSALLCAEGLLGGLTAGLIFLIFFRSGAGDAKLLIVVGAFTGPWFVLGTALYGAIAALPLALIIIWRRGVFGYTLQNFTANAAQRASGNRSVEIAANSKAGKMPYAVAIAAGVAITVLFYGWTGLALI